MVKDVEFNPNLLIVYLEDETYKYAFGMSSTTSSRLLIV